MKIHFIDDSGTPFLSTFDKSLITIGRSPECDFVLNSPEVSWEHCTLSIIQNRVLCIDKNSSNGTRVNQELISRTWLNPEDVIEVGNQELTFKGI